jgi:hypothetical protein
MLEYTAKCKKNLIRAYFTACSENLVVRHFVKKIGWHPANSAEGQHSHWLCILSVLHISAALATSKKYVAAKRDLTCRVVECSQACMTGIVGRQRFNFSDSSVAQCSPLFTFLTLSHVLAALETSRMRVADIGGHYYKV